MVGMTLSRQPHKKESRNGSKNKTKTKQKSAIFQCETIFALRTLSWLHFDVRDRFQTQGSVRPKEFVFLLFFSFTRGKKIQTLQMHSHAIFARLKRLLSLMVEVIF